MGKSLLLAWMLFSGLPSGWSPLPAPPTEREWAVRASIGTGVVLWGGSSQSDRRLHRDGFAYDAAGRHWRPLPPSPLAPRRSAAAVWTGRELLVWGGAGRGRLGDGAAYDPATGSWRMLPPAPISAREPAVSAWTGRELIVWADASRASARSDGAAFDPRGWSWRRLPRAPLPMNEASATWTGSELIVLGARLNGRNFAPYRWARAIAYEPRRDRWRRLPPVRITPNASSIGWTGREAVAWGYMLGAVRYDPRQDRWRRLPDVPFDAGECGPETIDVGGRLLAWYCGNGAFYARGAWTQVATPEQLGFPVAAGARALFPGRTGWWEYRPRSRERPDGRLVLGVHARGEFAAVADPRTGAIRRRRLAGGTLCHGPLLPLGDRVVFSAYRGDRGMARTLPLSLEGRAGTLGRADTITPSSMPGRLWLGRWPGPRPRRWSNRPVAATLSEVDAAGAVRRRAGIRAPRFSGLHAALGARFVSAEGRWLTLRAPGARRPLMRVRDGRFVAAHRSRFAWCGGKCDELRVFQERSLPLPAGARWLGSGAAFSPDGRELAVALTLHGRSRLAVADLRTRRWTMAPGTLGGYQTMAWSPSGRWLYFTAGERDLRAWQPGTSSSTRLPIEPEGTVMSIATAP